MEDVDAGKTIGALFEKKLILFKRYLTLTEGMKEAMNKKAPIDLPVFLSKREDCIAEIENVDSSIETVIQERGDDRPHFPAKLQGRIDGCFKDLKDVMGRVASLDKELTAQIREEGENIKMALLKTQNAIKAATGYKRPGKASPRFLDTVR